ncbi:MAG: response regulator [Deltaproteobacteria bacterium]|jgi:CheY-like chemotaxis protein|nr:response regulator [Deltaproteobacteria bacterium]MBT4641215.1 response regulator [Deltaproteobacteria bacterium]MBT6498638.1 response regulator [Deltaproteobacteria bacterium]MBT6613452.1 response regulator [Deltaproteobacteria bacterium]MBT7153524.1 response regulator [Deltaproteobacteria bacterium]
MKTILIIDDEKDSRDLIAHLLEPLGYRIIQATNGIAGVRMALHFHPDLITVDVKMPHLNGLNMMKIFNLMKLKIPSLFVTVKSDMEKFVDLFPSILSVCTKDQLQEKLFGMVKGILEQDKEREFSDIKYSLNSQEVFGLLGKSDRKKILIVADTLTREMVMTMFSDSELYEIYFAPDGQEAVFKAVMTRPDLIVSDLELPEFDGIMLARVLYILGHPFPLVFLSEKSDKETITKASKLEGIRGFLLKSEIRKDHKLIQERIERILNISDEDKARLQASYETIDIEKIEEFTMESSIWASLSP